MQHPESKRRLKIHPSYHNKLHQYVSDAQLSSPWEAQPWLLHLSGAAFSTWSHFQYQWEWQVTIRGLNHIQTSKYTQLPLNATKSSLQRGAGWREAGGQILVLLNSEQGVADRKCLLSFKVGDSRELADCLVLHFIAVFSKIWLNIDPKVFLANTISGAEWCQPPGDQVVSLLTALCCQKNTEMPILGKESDTGDVSQF